MTLSLRQFTSTVRVLSLVVPALALLGACQNPVGGGHNLLRATDVVITDLQNNTLATTQGAGAAGWIGGPLMVPEGGELPVRIFFISSAGERFQLPLSGAEHTLRVDIANESIAIYQGQTTQGSFHGRSPGSTSAIIHVWHGVHADFSTDPNSPLVIQVAPVGR